MDTLTKEQRRKTMTAVKSINTKPELVVRRVMHAAGLRFRLHRKDLPGKPDIVLTKHHTVVFVHGCFWHQHAGCKAATRPSSRSEYWNLKLDGNLRRDLLHTKKLIELGWRVVVLWECETKDLEDIKNSILMYFPEKL
jgi:DNA mismatch endonuclease (patch repair protein)